MNAKISDYGISRFSTPDGLMAQEGTPAYRAPEVIRGETYSFKVQCSWSVDQTFVDLNTLLISGLLISILLNCVY